VTGQTLVVDGGAIIADTSLQAVRNSP
jgi:hypothetical protein